MKIVSWNVNGLRSTEEQFLQFMARYQPEVVLLQELRCHPNNLSFFLKMIPGYRVEFNDSGRPGYAGTALYYQESLPIKKISFLKNHSFLGKEGRTIFFQIGEVVYFNFYTPNGNSSPKRLKFKLKFYQAVTNYLEKLLGQKKKIIVGGDLNVAHTELDVFAPQNYQHHSGFLPEEKRWFDHLLEIGFTDTFRVFNQENGHYTWWHMKDPKRKLNRGWRFDYFLVSKTLVSKVKKSVILKNVFGSDHCPISLEINI
ncbi:exodeoxyribonuclease III [Patescibacteria group bacterium]